MNAPSNQILSTLLLKSQHLSSTTHFAVGTFYRIRLETESKKWKWMSLYAYLNKNQSSSRPLKQRYSFLFWNMTIESFALSTLSCRLIRSNSLLIKKRKGDTTDAKTWSSQSIAEQMRWALFHSSIWKRRVQLLIIQCSEPYRYPMSLH